MALSLPSSSLIPLAPLCNDDLMSAQKFKIQKMINKLAIQNDMLKQELEQVKEQLVSLKRKRDDEQPQETVYEGRVVILDDITRGHKDTTTDLERGWKRWTTARVIDCYFRSNDPSKLHYLKLQLSNENSQESTDVTFSGSFTMPQEAIDLHMYLMDCKTHMKNSNQGMPQEQWEHRVDNMDITINDFAVFTYQGTRKRQKNASGQKTQNPLMMKCRNKARV